MRVCPICKEVYASDQARCAKDGAALVDDTEVSMSDTLTSSAIVSSAGGGGGTASPTPAPVVRSNPGPTPSHASLAPIGTDSIVGTSLAGRYEVTRKIGEGGMGVVYEARHTLIGKRVAIKVLLDKYAQKADIVARLQQEARLASSIGHEHIVDITDFGETSDGRTFVVMEFLEGESLAQLLSREGPLPPHRAVAIARQVASALGAAHGKGIVHRDIKPENVFITRRSERDFVKVVDFGISKAMRHADEDGSGSAPGASSSPRLTHTGMVLGTPLYMSPEQARGEDDLDHRIDVYAVGVILYELITGEVPFRGTNYLSIISQVLSVEPTAPSKVRPDLQVSPALETVVLRAMAKDRNVRYQSMQELDADLAKVEQGDTVLAQSAAHLGSTPRRRSRLVTLLWIGGIAVIVLGTAAAIRPLSGTKKQKVAQAADIAMVNVKITSLPPGADVWDGNVRKGPTPLTLAIPKDKTAHAYTLKLAGYDDAIANVTPNDDQTIPVTMSKTIVKPPVDDEVTVQISSVPSNAQVLNHNNEIIGMTPATLSLPKGVQIELRIEQDGYEPQPIEFKPEKNNESHSVKLVKAKTPVGPVRPKNPKTPPVDPCAAVAAKIDPTNPDVPPSPFLKKPCPK